MAETGHAKNIANFGTLISFLQEMSNLLDAGVDIKPVITHKYSYEDFEQGFEAIKQGNCGKVVLDFEEI